MKRAEKLQSREIKSHRGGGIGCREGGSENNDWDGCEEYGEDGGEGESGSKGSGEGGSEDGGDVVRMGVKRIVRMVRIELNS